MNSILQALRQALRSLRRSPAFTLTVIATLGIGIGLNAAIFTVVDCVLLRPLGYHDADRIVTLRTNFIDENRSIPRMGGDDYVDLSYQVKGLEATAFYGGGPDGIQVNGGALYLPIAYVSPGFGKVLGIEPVAGRLFQPDDRNEHNALIGAAFARDHFGSAQAALGQVIRWNGEIYPIVGVLPQGFSFPESTAVWLETPKPFTASRTSYSQNVIAKRRAGVSRQQLAAELEAFSRQLQQSFVDDRNKSIDAIPLQEQLVGKVRPALRLLMGAVAIVLLIVCVNITHLQLVRSMQRMHATSIRTALGAGRKALAGQALIETLLLAGGGCCAALMLAVPGLRLLVRLAPPDIPRLGDVHPNFDVLFFSLSVSGAVMALTALLPVWRSWHINPATALRQDTSRGTESRGSLRLRNGFVVAEIALTLTLAVAAMLTVRELLRESREDLGFLPENLVTLDMHTVGTAKLPDFPDHGTPTEQAAALKAIKAAAQMYVVHLNGVLDTLGTVPGVVSTAAVLGAPMGSGGSTVSFAVAGSQVFAPPFKGLAHAEVHVATPGFFNTLSVPLLHGRGLSETDTVEAPLILVINAALAQQAFPGQNPIGHRIMCGFDSFGDPWTIVGVVGDVRADSPGQPPVPAMYVPAAQHPIVVTDMQLVVRTRGDAPGMADLLRRRLLAAHPEIAVKGSTMLSDVGETEKPQQFRTTLLSSFAFVSILLAAVGMYGVTAYSVAQRRFEFGLRIALGANRVQVLGMVLGKATTYAAIGICIGIALSLGLVRVLASVVGKLPAFDLAAYAIASFTVLSISTVATFLPARAAANVDPMTVLRSE